MTCFLNNFLRLLNLNDGVPAELVFFETCLDAAELVVKFLAPWTWFAVTEGVALAGLRIIYA